MSRTLTVLVATIVSGAVLGCADPKEQYGRTWYLDGAGNWGFGVGSVAEGLERAGYRGRVNAFVWTSSFNPALDQVNIALNKVAAQRLANNIDDYLNRYPGTDVNLIALSAGNGIAMWAIERIRPPHKVNNFVMLGASISYNYNISRALRNLKGKIYCYYSPSDEILTTAVRALGTVDRTNEESAGLVGLHPPRGVDRSRVVNIGWNSRYLRYGWTGAHTDATAESFVRAVISRHILGRSDGAPRRVTSGPAPPTHTGSVARADAGWSAAPRAAR